MPAPGPEALRSRWILRAIVYSGVVSIVILMLSTIRIGSVPARSGKSHSRGEAMTRIKDVGILLRKFEFDYGCFPDASTIPALKAATGTTLTLDDSSSNKLFRQLLGYGLQEERPFWVRSSANRKKPDDDFTSDSTALQPGECSFSYVPGLSSKSDPATPVVMIPLHKGTTRFDRKPYAGQAVILFADGSVKSLPIDWNDRVEIGGMDLFDPRQPFWKGKAPDIKWQE